MASSKTAAAAAGKGPSTSISATLVSAAQPHIPKHGFSIAAVKAAIEDASSSSTPQYPHPHLDPALARSLNEWNLGRLFPGPLTRESSIPLRLLRRWDSDQWLKATAQCDPHTPTSKGTGSVDDAIDILEARLLASADVRHHLIEPFSLLCATSLPLSLSSFLPKSLPFLPVPLPDSLLNPLPLISRSASLADDACSVTHLDKSFGAEWYTTRMKLAAAYLAAELHLIAPASDPASSTRVLRDIATAPVPSISTLASALAPGGLVAAYASRSRATTSTPSSRPWPTQASLHRRSLATLSRPRLHTRSTHASQADYSTFPNQSQVADTFATPFGHFLAIISRIARIIAGSAFAAALAAFAIFEGTHLYTEHVAMRLPAASKRDDFGWYAEAEEEAWSRGNGTDSRLGIIGRHTLRSAWMCANWGAGINPELIFHRPDASGPSGQVSTPSFAADGIQADGLGLAANFLARTLTLAEERGIRLPDMAAVKAGLETPHKAGADAPLDKTALALESRLASVRERLGTASSLALAISGYERIYDALAAAEATHEAVGNSGQPGVASSRLIRLATRLGNLYAQMGRVHEAEGWLIKAVELTAQPFSGSVADIAGQSDISSAPASRGWLSGWLGGGSDQGHSHEADGALQRSGLAGERMSTSAVAVSPSVSRAVSGALLSLSGLYASAHSPAESSPAHPTRQANLIKALSIQVLLQNSLLDVTPTAGLSLTASRSAEQRAHEAWLQHAIAVSETHMAETLYALSSVKQSAKKAQEILAGCNVSALPTEPDVHGSIALLEDAAQRAKMAHDVLVKTRASSSSGSPSSSQASRKYKGAGTEGLLPIEDLKASFAEAGPAIETPAAVLVRDTRRVQEQCRVMLGVLTRAQESKQKKKK